MAASFFIKYFPAYGVFTCVEMWLYDSGHWKMNLPSCSSVADWIRLLFLLFCCINFSLCLYNPSTACCSEASPQRDAAAATLCSGDNVFLGRSSSWCLPNVALSLMTLRLHFLLADVGASHMHSSGYFLSCPAVPYNFECSGSPVSSPPADSFLHSVRMVCLRRIYTCHIPFISQWWMKGLSF